MIPRKHHFWSFLAITIAVCQIQMILTLIPLQNEHEGMGICAKHNNFFQSGNDSKKTPFLVVFGYNNCNVSNPNDFNTHTSSNSICWYGDLRKTYKFYSELKMFLKNLHYLSFLAKTIPVCQIQMILTRIPLQNEHDGMGICAKHNNFFQSRNDSKKTPFLVVFGYNNCNVSNPNDFNTHTSSKSICWDGDMRKTYKVYSELKILLKNLHYLSFLAITIAVCQMQMILTLTPLQNRHVGMEICAKHTNFIGS